MTDDNGSANPKKININFDLTDDAQIEAFLYYKESTGLQVSNAAIARKAMTEGLKVLTAPKKRRDPR